MVRIQETDDSTGLETAYALVADDILRGTLAGATFGGFDEPTDTSDFVRFTVGERETLTFQAAYLSGDYAGQVMVNIRDADGELIRDIDTTPIGNGDTYTFLEAGTYYAEISIYDYYDSGTYEFSFETVETPEQLITVTPITVISDTISELGETDTFALNVEARATYRVMFERDTTDYPIEDEKRGGIGDLDRAELVLTDGDGTVLASSTSFGIPTDDVLFYTATETEQVFVSVSGRYDEPQFDTGNYRVIFDRIDLIEGSDGDDMIIATKNDEEIYSFSGDDMVEAGSGTDFVDSGDGSDIVSALSGQNRLYGGDQSDFLLGGFDADVLEGGAGNDIIVADNNALVTAADRIIGGTGNDLLVGGGGADVFVFRPDDGLNIISRFDFDPSRAEPIILTDRDFQLGVDKIELDGFGYSSADEALANLTTVDGGAVFFDQDTGIAIGGVTAEQLSANDFVIV